MKYCTVVACFLLNEISNFKYKKIYFITLLIPLGDNSFFPMHCYYMHTNTHTHPGPMDAVNGRDARETQLPHIPADWAAAAQ